MTFFDYPTGESTPPDERGDYLLPGASEADWADLLCFATTHHVAAGETLIAPGSLGRSLYLVADGVLEVMLPTPHGRWHRVGTVGTGSLLGELAFLDGQVRSALVRATTPVTVSELTFEDFSDLATERPDLALLVAMDLGRILAGRVRRHEAADLAGMS